MVLETSTFTDEFPIFHLHWCRISQRSPRFSSKNLSLIHQKPWFSQKFTTYLGLTKRVSLVGFYRNITVVSPLTIDISPINHSYFNGRSSGSNTWRYVSIICLAIFWYPLGLKIGIFLIVGTSNLGSWNGYWKPIYTYLFESQLIQSNLITDMLTGSVTQSRSPCSPDALSICCCPANSWATDPPRRWGVSHFCGPWCCWWVFTQRRRSILICIYIYILCMYTVYVYVYIYIWYIYMCVCVISYKWK